MFAKGSRLYIPLFRYFAKLLGCHLADIAAPMPLHLSRFVARQTDCNRIWLQAREDITYKHVALALPNSELPYAAHGGLIVITKKPKFLPSRLYSTLTIGPIQFIYYYNLTIFEVWEMRLRHPDFVRWCAAIARRACEDPIPQSKLEQLGLLQ